MRGVLDGNQVLNRGCRSIRVRRNIVFGFQISSWLAGGLGLTDRDLVLPDDGTIIGVAKAGHLRNSLCVGSPVRRIGPGFIDKRDRCPVDGIPFVGDLDRNGFGRWMITRSAAGAT